MPLEYETKKIDCGNYIRIVLETYETEITPFCLSEAIAEGLVDQDGFISNRKTGHKHRLDYAIATDLICSIWREVVDVKQCMHVTIERAIALNILNIMEGRFVNNVTKEELTFKEAYDRKLICIPITLREAIYSGIYDEATNKISSAVNSKKLSISEAIDAGVLDVDFFYCIRGKNGDAITLAKALAEGSFRPSEGMLLHEDKQVPIKEAIEQGLIGSSQIKSLFNLNGFKDTLAKNDCFISFNEALEKNILIWKINQFFIDDGNGALVKLNQGVKAGLITKKVFEMFNRTLVLQDNSVILTNIADLIGFDLFNPKTGYLLHPKTKTQISFNEAVKLKFIAEDDANRLQDLLNISVGTETLRSLKKDDACAPDARSDSECRELGSNTNTEVGKEACFDETLTSIPNQENRDLEGNMGPGNVYIFNNDNFAGSARAEPLNNREGSKVDVENLKEVFGKYELNISEYNNLTVDDIKTEITKISEANLSKCSCIVFALLSHGGRDQKICALDGDYSVFDTIIFKIIKNPTLQGKPKIFLVQACKGTTNPLEFGTDGDQGVPDEFLIFFSTFEGYISYRNSHGSIFIRNFCREFQKDGGRLDIKLIAENTLKIVKRDSGGIQIPSIWGNLTIPYIFGDYLIGNRKKSYALRKRRDRVGLYNPKKLKK